MRISLVVFTSSPFSRFTNSTFPFRCECPQSFTGPLCQHNLNECESSPCVHGICVDQEDGFRCFCQPGTTSSFESSTSITISESLRIFWGFMQLWVQRVRFESMHQQWSMYRSHWRIFLSMHKRISRKTLSHQGKIPTFSKHVIEFCLPNYLDWFLRQQPMRGRLPMCRPWRWIFMRLSRLRRPQCSRLSWSSENGMPPSSLWIQMILEIFPTSSCVHPILAQMAEPAGRQTNCFIVHVDLVLLENFAKVSSLLLGCFLLITFTWFDNRRWLCSGYRHELKWAIVRCLGRECNNFWRISWRTSRQRHFWISQYFNRCWRDCLLSTGCCCFRKSFSEFRETLSLKFFPRLPLLTANWTDIIEDSSRCIATLWRFLIARTRAQSSRIKSIG